MSIKDFEGVLKSKLINDFNKLGVAKAYIDQRYWFSMIPVDMFSEMFELLTVDDDCKMASRYLRADDLLQLGQFFQKYGINPVLTMRYGEEPVGNWCEIWVSDMSNPFRSITLGK